MKHKALILAGLGLMLVAGATFGQRASRLGSMRRGVVSPDRNQAIFSATEIISYPDRDNSVGRFDSRTGAIYRFRGSLDNPSVRNTWEMRVPPVREPHSGNLEIQQIPARQDRQTSQVPPEVLGQLLHRAVTLRRIVA